jgi:hypothetical protein
MSKVKITGHASGSGVLTVTAPNTSTDRTITLPDSTGTILDNTSTLDATKLSGNLPAISGASLTSLPVQKINPNILINGGFDIAQRGTTISGIGSAKYTLDRWKATSSGADSTVTQVSGATYPKALRLTGAGSTSGTYLQQRVESANSRHLAGQTATFSVYLRASTAKTVEFSIGYASGGTDTFSGTTGIASANFSVTTTDTKFTWTGSIPSAATTGIQVELKISSQGSAWYEASNAKLEIGSTATDFEYRSYGEELAMCQRYYQKTNTNTVFACFVNGTNQVQFSPALNCPLRASPTVSWTGGTGNSTVVDHDGTVDSAASNVPSAVDFNDGTNIHMIFNGWGSSLTDMRIQNLYIGNKAIAMESEL